MVINSMVWHYPSHLHPGNKDSEQHQYQLTTVPLKKKKQALQLELLLATGSRTTETQNWNMTPRVSFCGPGKNRRKLQAC